MPRIKWPYIHIYATSITAESETHDLVAAYTCIITYAYNICHSTTVRGQREKSSTLHGGVRVYTRERDDLPGRSRKPIIPYVYIT